MSHKASLSVVVPTLNAAATLAATLASVADADGAPATEVIVVDGGSVDATVRVATDRGARVIEAPRGRGHQLAAAAVRASAPWLLFLHADTRLSADWPSAVGAFTDDPANERRAGYFHFTLDDDARAARVLEALVAARCQLFGLPYGDQGLLIHRRFYDALGGYRRMELMEDVDLVRRIGRNNVRPLTAHAVTSAARYRREGYLLRPLRNAACLALYTLGAPPRLIGIVYG